MADELDELTELLRFQNIHAQLNVFEFTDTYIAWWMKLINWLAKLYVWWVCSQNN